MARIRLIHWNQDEWNHRRLELESWGHDVDPFDDSPDAYRSIRQSLPDLVVISLDRLPSHGKEVGRWVRTTKATRELPLIYVGGEANKVANVRAALPNECFITWKQLKRSIPKTITQAAPIPSNLSSDDTGYSQTPLPKKLGIKPGMSLLLLKAPTSFRPFLDMLPESVKVIRSGSAKGDVILWFPQSEQDLKKSLPQVAQRMQDRARLWIVWPKKTSHIDTDLSRDLIREVGLSAGLIDFKICAIDATFSALCFATAR